jgi:hypothetical protein
MKEEIFEDIAIEQAAKDKFGISLDIAEVVVRGAATGITSKGTVFRTSNGQMWLYIVSHGTQLFDDVQKIVNRMNVEADLFAPPHAEADYFNRIGRDKFKTMFPGKSIRGEDDLRYYKKLALYNPALIRLSKVKGEIRAYDPQSKSWHKAKDYAYSKIKTI